MTAKCYSRFGFPLAALAFLAGQLVGQTMQHEAEVKAAQFSPNGRWVVTASKDHTARVWDAATGKPLGEPMNHEGVVNSAQFSPDGRWVVTVSEDNTARPWTRLPVEP
jgi:WD40 repeat protein